MKRVLYSCFLVWTVWFVISCDSNSLSTSIKITDRSNLGWHDYWVESNYSGGFGQPYFTWKVNDSQLNLQYNTSAFSLVLPFDGTWKIDLSVKVENDTANASYNLFVPNPGTLDYIKGKNMLGRWRTNIEIGGQPLDYNFTHMWKSTSSDQWNVIHQKNRGMLQGADGIGGYGPTTSYDYTFSDFEFATNANLFAVFNINDENMIGKFYLIEDNVWSQAYYFSANLIQAASKTPLNVNILGRNIAVRGVGQNQNSEIVDYSEEFNKYLILLDKYFMNE